MGSYGHDASETGYIYMMETESNIECLFLLRGFSFDTRVLFPGLTHPAQLDAPCLYDEHVSFVQTLSGFLPIP